MKCELRTSTLELTKVTGARNDRETSALGLEHYDHDDEDRENHKYGVYER